MARFVRLPDNSRLVLSMGQVSIDTVEASVQLALGEPSNVSLRETSRRDAMERFEPVEQLLGLGVPEGIIVGEREGSGGVEVLPSRGEVAGRGIDYLQVGKE